MACRLASLSLCNACPEHVGCATVQGPAAAAFSLSLQGSVGNLSAFFALANGAFSRFRWCSAFSAPLPTRSLLCLFRVGCATVQGPAAAAFSLSLEGSVGNVSAFFALANGAFFARFGTRFRWCSVFSAPLPTRSLLCLFRVGCATVQGPAAAAFSLSLEGSVGNVSAFFALGRFGTRFRWCSAFSAPLPTRSG